MCLLTRGSRPSSARPGKIVLRDAIGLAVDLDREDSSFYRHLEQIGKDISFGVVDNILVIWSFDWILHLSWWSRRTLNHSGGNRYQWSCDLRSNDIYIYIYGYTLLCLTYPLFAGQEGGAYVAVQPVVLNLRWDLVAAISDLRVVRSVVTR